MEMSPVGVVGEENEVVGVRDKTATLDLDIFRAMH